MNNWVTSDTHFNHVNICGPKLSRWDKGYRHFDSLEEMNDLLIDNINAVVQEEDVLWHLGDFAMGPRDKIPELLERINCKKVCLILGNHDEVLYERYSDLFWEVVRYKEIRVGKTLVCMFHYPLGSWNEIGRGSVCLHGHSHGTYLSSGRMHDVGVDCYDFRPHDLNVLVDKVTAREVVFTDGHDADTNYA